MKKTIFWLVLITLVAAGAVPAQEMRYDSGLEGLALNRLDRVRNLVIWPNDPELGRMMSRPLDNERIYLTFHYPVRNRPTNGYDMRFYQGEALVQMANLISNTIKDYNLTAMFKIYGDDVPESVITVTESITIRKVDDIIRNVRREGEVLYSGELPDGSMLYGGSLILSVSQNEVTSVIENILPITENTNNAMDLQRRIDLIQAILARNSALIEDV